jgi:nucleotide sugar dehydrogenase
MSPVGIVGQGFVGTAVREGLRHAFDIWTYDKKDPRLIVYKQTGEEILDAEPVNVIVQNCKIVFVCVPTPMKPNGVCDLSVVEDVIENLVGCLKEGSKLKAITIKSTVPPGTSSRLNTLYSGRGIVVCFNPEFLTERNSIQDFKNQDRIILGGPREGTNLLKTMYERAYPNVPTTKTGSTIAEMVKYVTNCFLATKVAFANEIYEICEKLEIDYDKVVEYATKDKRLGASHWSVPGPDGHRGFGLTCFPKDLNALTHLAIEIGVNPVILKSVWEKNLLCRPERDWEKLVGRAVSQNE